ncbi:hypothetical protein [Selenihalanaerobacter shriftii]|uniref:Uncharacterized protein n=1 Tax=Selenihalanaerobacter shriftii TaxID=142842 RepID=A0A1T4NH86_9FIRM|nr:hypothetical protein [Selenihalanaerobacter shriftii]SJZ78397.1 hypothetical protein SAMN02745118_01812 [Selenihalanaerobacter shriftii]
MKKKNVIFILVLGLVMSIFIYPKVANAKKLEVEDMIRKNAANGVMFDVALANPLLEKSTDKIIFKAWLTTHSGNLLDEINSGKLVIKINNGKEEQKVIRDNIEWRWDRKSSHHPKAYIMLKKMDDKGHSLITDATESIQLIIKNVRNVPTRKFTWDDKVALQSLIVD